MRSPSRFQRVRGSHIEFLFSVIGAPELRRIVRIRLKHGSCVCFDNAVEKELHQAGLNPIIMKAAPGFFKCGQGVGRKLVPGAGNLAQGGLHRIASPARDRVAAVERAQLTHLRQTLDLVVGGGTQRPASQSELRHGLFGAARGHGSGGGGQPKV